MATRGGAEVPVGWVSPDGVTWSRLPAKAFTFPSTGGAIHEISATSSGFVASGNSSSGILVWRSPTGHRWTALDTPKAAHHVAERDSLQPEARQRDSVNQTIALRRDQHLSERRFKVNAPARVNDWL